VSGIASRHPVLFFLGALSIGFAAARGLSCALRQRG
jgi:hypothetical protein